MAIWNTDKIGWSQTLRMAYKCAAGGNYKEAIKYYKEALKEVAASKALIYNNLADVYMNAGQINSALKCVENAINGVRGEVVPYITLGEIYQAKGEHGKAV